MAGKSLVAYFSASGVTRTVAQRLAQAADADLFEIEPERPYTAADLDWTDRRSRSTVEMNDPASRPAIAARVPDMARYDTVFIGFPIWWYVAPTIINTFLEGYDFSGKAIVLFATSGGSGMGNTLSVLKPLAPNATWATPKMLNGNPSASALKQWVEGLAL